MANNSFDSHGSQPADEVVDTGPPLTRYAPTNAVCKQFDGFAYGLDVIQDPARARMCGHGDKDRRPIGPPPVVRLVKKSLETGEEVDYK
jgi:hypothetical protein